MIFTDPDVGTAGLWNEHSHKKEMLPVVPYLQLPYQVVHKIPTTPPSSSSSPRLLYIIVENNGERLHVATHSYKIVDHCKRALSLAIIRNGHIRRPARSLSHARLGQCAVHLPAPTRHEQRIYVPLTVSLPIYRLSGCPSCHL